MKPACDPCPDCNCGRSTAAAGVDNGPTIESLKAEIDWHVEELKRVKAAEREACAKVADSFKWEWDSDSKICHGIAAAIRAME